MDILSFVLFLVVGGFAGWAASKIFKVDRNGSALTYVILGIIGAVVGSFVFQLLGFEVVGEGVVTDFIVAFIGAVVLLGLSRLVAGKLLK